MTAASHHRQRSPDPSHPRGGARRPGDGGQPRARSCATGTRSSRRCSRPSTRPSTRSTSSPSSTGPARSARSSVATCATGPRRASGCGCCSTPGARTRWTSRCSSRLEDAGAHVHWFRPLRRLRPGQVNHRTHRKVLITDEAVGFTGGVGIADCWQGDARNEDEWRDTHFRIEGPAVDGLRAAFLDNWAETGPELFDESVDRFPDQPQPGLVAGAVRAGRLGGRVERRGDAVPGPAAAGERADPDHDRVLRARRGAHRPPVRRHGPGGGDRHPPARPLRRQALRPAGRGGGVRPAAGVRRAPLALPAVDAPRQGDDGRPVQSPASARPT